MDDQIKTLLAKRRDRTIAIMLGFKERSCDQYLPQEVRVELRKVILDQINDFYELMLDLMNSVDDGSVMLNQEYLDKIDQIYANLTGV
jgi:hypothetical protein